MAQTRKDLRGRVLRKGESQRRSDGRYVYIYTDPLGRRKYVYAQDLVTLREKEAQLMKDQMDGLDTVSYTHLNQKLIEEEKAKNRKMKKKRSNEISL